MGPVAGRRGGNRFEGCFGGRWRDRTWKPKEGGPWSVVCGPPSGRASRLLPCSDGGETSPVRERELMRKMGDGGIKDLGREGEGRDRMWGQGSRGSASAPFRLCLSISVAAFLLLFPVPPSSSASLSLILSIVLLHPPLSASTFLPEFPCFSVSLAFCFFFFFF